MAAATIIRNAVKESLNNQSMEDTMVQTEGSNGGFNKAGIAEAVKEEGESMKVEILNVNRRRRSPRMGVQEFIRIWCVLVLQQSTATTHWHL